MPGSSFASTPLGHEDNLELRHHSGVNALICTGISPVLNPIENLRHPLDWLLRHHPTPCASTGLGSCVDVSTCDDVGLRIEQFKRIRWHHNHRFK
ncbi:hypothetical protein TNCV_436841 [Trichonephila clavipes]|nr:hypothetical protein TNCV_436841 [Trichonephila clavipes]